VIKVIKPRGHSRRYYKDIRFTSWNSHFLEMADDYPFEVEWYQYGYDELHVSDTNYSLRMI